MNWDKKPALGFLSISSHILPNPISLFFPSSPKKSTPAADRKNQRATAQFLGGGWGYLWGADLVDRGGAGICSVRRPCPASETHTPKTPRKSGVLRIVPNSLLNLGHFTHRNQPPHPQLSTRDQAVWGDIVRALNDTTAQIRERGAESLPFSACPAGHSLSKSVHGWGFSWTVQLC